MRMTKSKTTKPRKEISYYSVSLKDGYFTESELSQYGLSENEISIILDYQALLPILQEADESWISAKLLHRQLKVSRDFSNWIKQQINDLELNENVDYKIETPSKANQRKYGGDKESESIENKLNKPLPNVVNPLLW